MMKSKVLFALTTCFAVVGCSGETPITPGPGDLPGPRGMSPSVVEASGAGEFDVSSADISPRDWPVDTITYKAFQNTAQRAIYLRRALGRYAVQDAERRGLGTSLNKLRAVARRTSPSTSGEWWGQAVHRGDLLPGQPGRQVTLPDLVNSTVRNSYQIAAFGDLPAIRGTAIQEAKGRFVPEFYADASREHIEDWATSPAIAAGAKRAETDETQVEFGVRSRLQTGGEVSISQRITTTDTNRTAYIPGEQTTSKSVITYVQPLLRGGGFSHNDAPRRIANMDTEIAREEFHRQASAHLLEVERAFWNLYVARAVYTQKQRLAGQGGRIARQIGARAGFDADPILVSRARAKASQWRADMVRARAAMENAEFRLAALVNDSRLGPANVELVPNSAPNGKLRLLTTQDTIKHILTNRPEVQQAILQYEAALLREGMAANESLPELDLVLEASATGGANGRNAGRAFRREKGGVGSLVGIKFSVPLGFDERDARYHRRRIETVQQERQVLSSIATVLLEVDVAANEYIVACSDLVAQRQALAAGQADSRALRGRWDEGIGSAGIDLLSALLSSYETLQASEQAVAQARASREVAAANLARARGLLLERWGLEMDLTRDIRNEQTYKLRPTQASQRPATPGKL